MSNLKQKYVTELKASLKEDLGLSNVMQVPHLCKIVLNIGVSVDKRDTLKDLTSDLGLITGQLPLTTKARKSIANFKLREGMLLGAKTTLRGTKMYEFLDRLVNSALPRIRDFRGLSVKQFDSRGNYNFGIDDHTIFPEMDPDEVKHVHGMNITLVTSTSDDNAALALLKGFGMPFADKSEQKETGIG
jgi:large subunit ribosomal protein L5